MFGSPKQNHSFYVPKKSEKDLTGRPQKKSLAEEETKKPVRTASSRLKLYDVSDDEASIL